MKTSQEKEGFLFWTCILLACISLVSLFFTASIVQSQRNLIELMKGMEMPYETFSELTSANQKLFITNGGKVIESK